MISIYQKRKERNMTLIEEILQEIEKKNSWGKNELKQMILALLAKRFKGE